MKRFLVIFLAATLSFCSFTACSDDDDSNDNPPKESVCKTQSCKIELGLSGLSIIPDKKFVEGEISSTDTDENQVAYYKSDETTLDFDVYEWKKADGETLASAAAEEAKDFGNAEVKTTKINDLDIAYYYAKEENDGKTYDTVTYIIDNGEYFVELVFWLDGDNAKAEAEAILNTLAKDPNKVVVTEGNEISLGLSGLTLTPDKKYVKGEISTTDTDESQVAYYKSDDSLVDFDVYEWKKSDGETLASVAEAEVKDFENAEVKTTKINDLDVAYYYAKEENDGKEYDTVTYIIDNGEYFVELVFWLDGENAQDEVDAILNTLAKKN